MFPHSFRKHPIPSQDCGCSFAVSGDYSNNSDFLMRPKTEGSETFSYPKNLKSQLRVKTSDDRKFSLGGKNKENELGNLFSTFQGRDEQDAFENNGPLPMSLKPSREGQSKFASPFLLRVPRSKPSQGSSVSELVLTEKCNGRQENRQQNRQENRQENSQEIRQENRQVNIENQREGQVIRNTMAVLRERCMSQKKKGPKVSINDIKRKATGNYFTPATGNSFTPVPLVTDRPTSPRELPPKPQNKPSSALHPAARMGRMATGERMVLTDLSFKPTESIVEDEGDHISEVVGSSRSFQTSMLDLEQSWCNSLEEMLMKKEKEKKKEKETSHQ